MITLMFNFNKAFLSSFDLAWILGEPCHAKTCLKTFFLVIEGLAGGSFCQKTIQILYWKVGVIPKEGLAGPRPPIFLFVWQWQRSLGTFSMTSSACYLLAMCLIPGRCRVCPLMVSVVWETQQRMVKKLSRPLWSHRQQHLQKFFLHFRTEQLGKTLISQINSKR